MSVAVLKADTRVWREIVAQVKAMDGIRIRVGVLSSKGGSAEAAEGASLSLVDLAAIHEFGTEDGKIPERSFIRDTFTFYQSQLTKFQHKLVTQICTGKMSAATAGGLLGTWGANQVRQYIRSGGQLAPLAPSTIEAKGSSKPLVDTGQLINSVVYDVVGSSDDAGNLQAAQVDNLGDGVA